MRDALKLSIPVEGAGALSEGWTPRDRQGKGGNTPDMLLQNRPSAVDGGKERHLPADF